MRNAQSHLIYQLVDGAAIVSCAAIVALFIVGRKDALMT